MISPAALAQIRERCHLPKLIGEYVRLQKSASRWVARCPFHKERTPSFTVWTDHFYCFGCGAGGSAINFLMRMEHLTFNDAVRLLAGRVSVSLEPDKLTRLQRTVGREDAALCRWWWWRKVEALKARMYQEIQKPDMDEDLTQRLGDELQWIRRLTVEEKFSLFLHQVTAQDRAAYEQEKSQWNQEVEAVWKPLLLAYLALPIAR